MTPVIAAVEATNVQKAFGRTPALRGASVRVEPGESVAITGPSGSGKSTLLLCLAGVLVPEAGEVSVLGQDLDRLRPDQRTRLRRREVGLVLQFGQLVPELSATENVGLPLLLERKDRRSAGALAHEWLDRLGVGEVADQRPSEMSGGQQQRVAIARALITAPRLILADEPTGALDSVAAESVLELLVTVARDTGASLVVVTHDNRVAATADREIVLRDGAVQRIGDLA